MSKNQNQPNFLMAFFSFRRMVSPTFIMVFYYFGLVAIVLGVIAALIGAGGIANQMAAYIPNPAGIVGYFFFVLFVGALLILAWRFYCELLIVLFSIFNRLGEISKVLHEPPAASSDNGAAPGKKRK